MTGAMEPTTHNCGYCHECLSTKLVEVLDGEEWCPECRQYRRYRTHGWANGDRNTCLDRAGWLLLGAVTVGAEVVEGSPSKGGKE